jgi:hypothetical protein
VTALCTIADVEALSGVPVPPDAEERVGRLIELASAVVVDACIGLPAQTPDTVATVTATLVVRQMANPTGATSEALGTWRVGYKPTGLVLTDDDRAALGPWAKPEAGTGAYSVWTPSPYAVDGWGDGVADFGRDDAVVPVEYAEGGRR